MKGAKNSIMLFKEDINNIKSWSNVFQSIHAFEPLIRFIFSKHQLELTCIENCTPGSNAVFKNGQYIIKIFAPIESQIGSEMDFITEQIGMKRANKLGVTVPKLIASGVIEDKYTFRYLVLEYLNGKSFTDVSNTLSDESKEKIGRHLRLFVDKLDVACDKFNEHRLFGEAAERRWQKFSDDFQKQRKEYISRISAKPQVYIHGDLNPDNMIVMEENRIFIIDFADALLAPIEFEYAGLICDAFKFERPYLKGFFGEYDKEELTELCLYGLLIHDFGLNIIRDNIGNIENINEVTQLRHMIYEKL